MIIRVYFEATKYSPSPSSFYERLGHELFWAIEKRPEVINVTYKITAPYPNRRARSAFQAYAATAIGYVTMDWDPNSHWINHPKTMLPAVAPVCNTRLRRVTPVVGKLVRNLQIHQQFVNTHSRRYVESRYTWLE